MAPRGKRAKATDRPSLSSSLVSALKFVSVAQKDNGDLSDTHCVLNGNTVVASNGVISAGQHIDEDITACPHTYRLIDALSKCGESLSITQLDSNRLSIRSDKFKAFVPCVDGFLLARPFPDNPCATINDTLKEGFLAVSCLVADSSTHVVTASILLQAGSMISTNRHAMLEYWHGIDLPPNLAIPKASALAVSKCGKTLVSLGYSANSVTFWFEDGSWIKTQIYSETWPDISKILNVPSNAWPIPVGFFKALDAVAPFSEDGIAHISKNLVSSHYSDGLGASYEVDGLPDRVSLNIKYLKLVEDFILRVDFIGVNGVSYFFGDKIRGAIASVG